MPNAQIMSYSKEYGVPVDKVEEFWDAAKKQYPDNYMAISGTVKKMCKQYKNKNRNEGIKMNNIEKSIAVLEGCGCNGKCDKKKCKCGDKCKCKKGKMEEGRTKHAMEDRVERMCICDGEISLDPKDHDMDCPAREYLKDNGMQ